MRFSSRSINPQGDSSGSPAAAPGYADAMAAGEVQELIEAADMNALLRVVDRLAERRAWDDLVDLAERCEDAVERGKQLWPIAAHVDYRLALEGPGDLAASVLDSDLQRFTLGPLTEVAASRHRWSELAPHIETPQAAAFVAQERVLRGEVIAGDERAHPEVLELPLRLEAWEPSYTLATYGPSTVEVHEPLLGGAALRPSERRDGELLDEPELRQALLDLVHQWTTESNGAAEAVVVGGGAAAAISSLTFLPFMTAPLSLQESLRLLAWAAASGGAYGRRRGSAFGRSMTWHLGRILADVDPRSGAGRLSAALSHLRWFRWDDGAGAEGWSLRFAVEDPLNGWAAALSASDLLEEEG